MTLRPMDKDTEYLLTRGYKFDSRGTNWIEIRDRDRGISICVDYYNNYVSFCCFIKSDRDTLKNGWEIIASTTIPVISKKKIVVNIDKKTFIDIVSDVNSTAADMLKKFNDYDVERTLETLDG